MVLIDRPLWHKDGKRWSHLISNESLDELHCFAHTLGVPRRAFQGDHYDIPESLISQALAEGATLVDPRELLRQLKAAGLRRSPTRE